MIERVRIRSADLWLLTAQRKVLLVFQEGRSLLLML